MMLNVNLSHDELNISSHEVRIGLDCNVQIVSVFKD